MRTYLANIIPRIKRYSEKLDNLTLLTNQHWVVLNELKNSKVVYIFRSNSELLISQNGNVEIGQWEYLGNDSLLIRQKEGNQLFRHGFFDANILALKLDGRDDFAILANQNNYGGDLNSIDKVYEYLDIKYLKLIPQNQIESSTYNVNPQYLNIPVNLDKDLNPVNNIDSKYGYMDKEKNLIIPCKYDGAYDFSEGLAVVYLLSNGNDSYGFIDEQGNEVIPLKYEFGENFSEGLAVVRQKGKFGYIDKHGEVKISLKFENADSFENGRARVVDKSGEYYIDKTGTEI